MRTLVTGCAGFIGSHFTEMLLEAGYDVVGVDCFNDNYARRQKLRNLERARDWERFDFVPVDLARGDLTELVEEADGIVHLAAEPGVRNSWGRRFEQYVRNNVLATHQLLDAARRVPETPFVYASSSSVYGQAEMLPTPETVTPAPFSPYGISKLAAENLCSAYHSNYGLNVATLRFFSVYGPRQRPDMAFARFCSALARKQPIEIYGDGSQTRDFTFVGDVVSATRAALEARDIQGAVFNIGGGSRVSLNRALGILQELSGRTVEVRRARSQRGDVRDTGAHIAAAQERLAFEPKTTLADGLASQWDWALAASGYQSDPSS